DAHLARGDESRDALRRRLRRAADDIDMAAIFTIHGFCARVLREHALESGQGFDPPELLASDAELRAAIAADLWRAHAVDTDAVDDLHALWPQGPDALAKDLSLLVREHVLLPEAPADLPDPGPMLRAAAKTFAEAARTHGDGFRDELLRAAETKVLNAGSYKAEWIQDLFDQLARWCTRADAGARFHHDKLGNLHRETLIKRTSKAGAGRTPDSPLCDAVQADAPALAAPLRAGRHAQLGRVLPCEALVDRGTEALVGPQGDARVERLRAQCGMALVDEFQDTDPRRWAIFGRVFGADSAEPALFLIGD